MMRRFVALLLLAVIVPACTGCYYSNTFLNKRLPLATLSRNKLDVTTSLQALSIRGGAALSDIDSDLVDDAFEWVSNLGAPAALVAGAVFASLLESRDNMGPNKADTRFIQVAKKLTRMLMLSSFALEIISIFVTTVTGTMLLSHGDRSAGSAAGKSYHSPMGFMRHNLEFEYLTSRITFLQGLINWLAAVAFENIIPKPGEGVEARRMNLFISSALVTIVLAMLSFYNHHMTFYANYLDMLRIYSKVALKRFVLKWPPRPMAYLYLPFSVLTCVLGYRALASVPEEEEIAVAYGRFRRIRQ